MLYPFNYDNSRGRTPYVICLYRLIRFRLMSGRQRSGTYSSLCESEIDFVPPVRSFSVNNLAQPQEADLNNALLKDADAERVTPDVSPSIPNSYVWQVRLNM